ncbi:transcriptional regulator [Streptomyces albidoflavus]|uniref:Transcriptional regulator n=1 Tax=Streptomyces wadayamensis TaxID=141454 RepID=A0ABR4S964_9ACTN|nr:MULTISPECIES: hypothetical protein [Streptomyces]MYQ74014.1 transcriptional regulator [Streptomyces sp. SID4934]KDR60949.1 transcriptional regulator [Streptomyces wadayamensis]QXQ25853.1 transcriptional regulator [Streptomyces albidoflavus]QXQ31782.1 transcriptional regulator [Streptomyces albidoflavus]SCE34943.1 hypothetical protein GA0115237_1119131 [Streptomyces sp. ScaeMP-6W]
MSPEQLASQLAPLLPGAAVVQVRLKDPRTLWPHMDLTAMSDQGQSLRVPRTRALMIARWLIRSFPQAGWASGVAFDLRTAQLRGLEA